jgi:hypothetical protein
VVIDAVRDRDNFARDQLRLPLGGLPRGRRDRLRDPHHYWSNRHALKPIISAIFALLLWPLLLVGINLHIH